MSTPEDDIRVLRYMGLAVTEEHNLDARKLAAFDDLLKAAEAMSFHYGLIFHDTPCASLVSFTKQPCDCIYGKFRTAIWKAKEAQK